MRLIPGLMLLGGCKVFEAGLPVFNTGTCLTTAMVASGTSVVGQAQQSSQKIPDIELHASGCLDLVSPISCEAQAQLVAYAELLGRAAPVVAQEIIELDFDFAIEGPTIQECD